jgi:hypothetical protein
LLLLVSFSSDSVTKVFYSENGCSSIINGNDCQPLDLQGKKGSFTFNLYLFVSDILSPHCFLGAGKGKQEYEDGISTTAFVCTKAIGRIAHQDAESA